jgi:hypothetical protein
MVGLKSLFLSVGFVASAVASVKRSSSEFSLYAYGAGIGGLEVYYADGTFHSKIIHVS